MARSYHLQKSWHQQITITPSDQTKENPANPARPGLGKDQSQELAWLLNTKT
jgi:hypothetical protein